MSYKNIFFDFDGTLVNTIEGTAKSAQYALQKFNIDTKNIENLGKIFCGPPLKESFSKFRLEENQIEDAIKFYKSYQRDETVELSKLYDGIKDLLIKLKELGTINTVVTLKSKETTVKILEYLNIYQYFDNVIGNSAEFPNQDKKEMLKYATKEVELSKSIMIGDRKSDIFAGKSCNIDTIAVLYGMETKEKLQETNPTFYATTPKEIYEIIKK